VMRCSESARTPQGAGFVAPSSSAARSGRGLQDVVRQGGWAFTLLVVPTLVIFLDLVRQHDGAALHPSSSMVSLRFLVSESLRRRIRNPQAGTNGGDVGLAAARCIWLLCVRAGSNVGGRLSLCPFLCGTVSFLNSIP
jgi:hypothetical protein